MREKEWMNWRDMEMMVMTRTAHVVTVEERVDVLYCIRPPGAGGLYTGVK